MGVVPAKGAESIQIGYENGIYPSNIKSYGRKKLTNILFFYTMIFVYDLPMLLYRLNKLFAPDIALRNLGYLARPFMKSA